MPGEVAAILHVDANTLARWADNGSITAVRTPGGHRRYLASEVRVIAAHGFWAPDGTGDRQGPQAPGPRRPSSQRPGGSAA